MVIVVKGGKEAEVIHAVDLPGWLAAGWSIKGEEKPKPTSKKGSTAPAE